MIWMLFLAGCVTDDYTQPTYPPVVPGPPVVGAAEGLLKLPVGTPLSGFTARCNCLGDFSNQDERQSAYVEDFGESTGVQTYPTIKVIWIDNGDDTLVLTKTDNIYSFDGLVDALEIELEARTGEMLAGRVVHTTNHTHSGWGTYSDQVAFYLGSDRYNEENFQRMVMQIADVAEEAYTARESAKIGMGWKKDWDPNDAVYSDRRGINNALRPWGDDSPDWVGGKDPYLGMIRFERTDGSPIAMLMNFGMHGIVLGEDSAMASSDSGGHVELAVRETFDEQVVVMFTQGSGGDQSPRGVQDDYARLESLGLLARQPIRDFWDEIETSDAPIVLDSFSRSIPIHPSQIRITRDGTVDWYYLPYEEGHIPDDVVYEEDGITPTSPFDEFNSKYGHAFCGTGDLDLPVGAFPTQAWPYSNCMDFEILALLIQTFFRLDPVQMPLNHTLKAGVTATRMGPLKVLGEDGTVTERDLLMGFFPGEATSIFTEQFKRRAKAELGYDNAMMVSYSQDHEGYLLIPEDFLLGEYEADIVLWGPLMAEHILEGWLDSVGELLGNDVHEHADPLGTYTRTVYPTHPLPEFQPDLTLDAGTRLETPPDYLWTPLDIPVNLNWPTEVPRGQRVVQMAWLGGDPGIDNPTVTLQRMEGGNWVNLTTPTGRTIDESMPDIILGHTPFPLLPHTDDQTHTWWAGWQAVDHTGDRMALALGTYRMVVNGQRYVGGDTTWPWTGEAYDVFSPEFEVVPATLHVVWDGVALTASLPAALKGFRLLHLEGDSRSDNPLVGPITVDVLSPSGDVSSEVDGVNENWRSTLAVTVPSDATSIQVTDAFGNTGFWTP